MGATKRLIEQNEEQERVAVRIAVQAGVLEQCDRHADCVYDGGNNVQNAYRTAAYRFKREADLQNLFSNQKELTDTIQRVVRENCGSDECQRCAHDKRR